MNLNENIKNVFKTYQIAKIFALKIKILKFINSNRLIADSLNAKL